LIPWIYCTHTLSFSTKFNDNEYDLLGNIRVYCRVRPFLTGQPNRFGTVDRIDEGSISIITPSKYGKEGRKSFSFNKVFGPLATQGEYGSIQVLFRSYQLSLTFLSFYFSFRGGFCRHPAFDPVCS